MACNPTLLDRLTNVSSFSTWKATTTNALNALTVESPANATILQGLETDVTNTLACAQQQVTTLSSTPTSLTKLQTDLTQARQSVTTATQDAQIAKERSRQLQTPEQKTTVYEGWFPMFRPLQTTSMFLILAFALFFTSVTLGLLTRQMGFLVQLGFEIPWFPAPAGKAFVLTPFMAGAGFIILALTSLLIYAFTRK